MGRLKDSRSIRVVTDFNFLKIINRIIIIPYFSRVMSAFSWVFSLVIPFAEEYFSRLNQSFGLTKKVQQSCCEPGITQVKCKVALESMAHNTIVVVHKSKNDFFISVCLSRYKKTSTLSLF